MGANLLFDPINSDFTSISNSDLFVSEIVHHSFFEINENGTEAAAASTVVMNKAIFFGGKEPEPVEFKCDRPFLFFIHTLYGILFIGKLVNPSK